MRRDDPRPLGRSDKADTLAVFAVLWALAACWHLVGNPGLAPRWSELLVVVAAGAVLWAPGSVPPLVGLAAVSLVLLWHEAPVLGNHWLLVGFVDLVILVGFALSALRRRFTDRIDLAERVFPAVRLCLLVFYAFAAFAKLNSAYLDRSVSCAPVFFREATDSIGASWLQLGGGPLVDNVVIGATVAVELAIPLLLLRRRLRPVGVVVGLGFHLLLAVDRTHQFFDFSSVLFALLVLFLPQTFGAWVGERVGSVRARLALRGPRLPYVARGAVVALPMAVVLPVVLDLVGRRGGLLLGWWPWQVVGLAAFVVTVRYLRQRPPAYGPAWRLWPHHVGFLAVPLLVLANGLTPYLELKTAFGWNMYSNLRTVDGESNHLLLGRSFPLTGEQAEVVEIVRSGSPDLAAYADADYGLAPLQLQGYLEDHPEVSITYERAGERVTLRRAGDLDELVRSVPTWREKFQVFRAVDLGSPERCQPGFGAAR